MCTYLYCSQKKTIIHSQTSVSRQAFIRLLCLVAYGRRNYYLSIVHSLQEVASRLDSTSGLYVCVLK